MNDEVVLYWYEQYYDVACTLCANTGIIDTRGLMTEGGCMVGRLNYCICPNGQLNRQRNAILEKE